VSDFIEVEREVGPLPLSALDRFQLVATDRNRPEAAVYRGQFSSHRAHELCK
jgi:hypothetical protein